MRCQGYIVTVYDAECQPIEEYSEAISRDSKSVARQGTNCLTSGSEFAEK
jgi:hypothetical protein